MSAEQSNFQNPDFNGLDSESLAFLRSLHDQAEQGMAPADQAVKEAEQAVLDAFGEEGSLPLEKQTYSADDTVLSRLAGEFHDDLQQSPDGIIPPVKHPGGFSQANRDVMQEQLRRNGYTDENGTWHSLF